METWRRTGGEIPEFEVNLLAGGVWRSREVVAAGRFTLLNVYRGSGVTSAHVT